jgi:O-methyltransferase
VLRRIGRVCVGILCVIGALALAAVILVAVGSQRIDPLATKAVYSTARNLPPAASAEDRYLDLMKRVLTRYSFGDNYQPLERPKTALKRLPFMAVTAFNSFFRSRGAQVVKYSPFSPEVREVGGDWPAQAETMVGLKRLDNIQYCVTSVIQRKIPGDLIECGAWRGGSCIFMRAILATYGVKDRVVWVSDSFEGLPKPAANSEDAQIWSEGSMAVSIDEVRQNFAKYGLLDDQVKFLKGFFKDTLPGAPIKQLAVLRVDGDLYESVTDTLQNLYPKVAVGGFVILDDYYSLAPAKRAADEYRKAHGITEALVPIDPSSVYWQREK